MRMGACLFIGFTCVSPLPSAEGITKWMPKNAAAKARMRFCGGICWHPFFARLLYLFIIKRGSRGRRPPGGGSGGQRPPAMLGGLGGNAPQLCAKGRESKNGCQKMPPQKRGCAFAAAFVGIHVLLGYFIYFLFYLYAFIYLYVLYTIYYIIVYSEGGGFSPHRSV